MTMGEAINLYIHDLLETKGELFSGNADLYATLLSSKRFRGF